MEEVLTKLHCICMEVLKCCPKMYGVPLKKKYGIKGEAQARLPWFIRYTFIGYTFLEKFYNWQIVFTTQS
jgi:hypothetical protein